MIRALVVDDQRWARERLVALLSVEPDVDVVATCASGFEAVQAIRELKPDLVFLDLEMPELDGFGVVQAIGADAMPATIFVTAYDQYAIRAFEVHALDYLLKPFARDRFLRSLQRGRAHLAQREAAGQAARMSAMLAGRHGSSEGHGRLMIRAEGRARFVDIGDIDWAEADRNHVKVHVGEAAYAMRGTLTDLLERLGDTRFCRIHRSLLVNIQRISELRFAAGGDYEVVLHDGRHLRLSRLFREQLEARLTQ